MTTVNETVMRRLAKPMLFAAALIWGSSFFIMKGAVDVIPTFYLLAIRFTAARCCWAWCSGKNGNCFLQRTTSGGALS